MNQRDRADPFKTAPASSRNKTRPDEPVRQNRVTNSAPTDQRTASPARMNDDHASTRADAQREGVGRRPRDRTRGQAARVLSRQTLPDEIEDHDHVRLPELDQVDADDVAPPPIRRASRRVSRQQAISASAVARRRSSSRHPSRSFRLPGSIARSALIADQVSLVLLGVAVFSLLLMWITIANRAGSLPDSITLRYGAEGLPSLSGAPRALFRLPLLATVVTLMNFIVAWSVSAADRFAARFIVAAAILVHLLIWIAVAALVS